MRILVIDDDSAVRMMIVRMLTGEGHEVAEAANGNEGMRIVENQAMFDLVITDLIMPEKEGLETIQALRKNHKNIKILAISGGGTGSARGYLSIARRLGANNVLSKPFLKQELLDAINTVFAKEQ